MSRVRDFFNEIQIFIPRKEVGTYRYESNTEFYTNDMIPIDIIFPYISVILSQYKLLISNLLNLGTNLLQIYFHSKFKFLTFNSHSCNYTLLDSHNLPRYLLPTHPYWNILIVNILNYNCYGLASCCFTITTLLIYIYFLMLSNITNVRYWSLCLVIFWEQNIIVVQCHIELSSGIFMARYWLYFIFSYCLPISYEKRPCFFFVLWKYNTSIELK